MNSTEKETPRQAFWIGGFLCQVSKSNGLLEGRKPDSRPKSNVQQLCTVPGLKSS